MHHTKQPKLISSPLQGITDFRFRNAYHQYFGGIDQFYAPYIRLNKQRIIRPKYQLDLVLKHNMNIKVIPQVMTNTAEEFILVANYVKGLGYSELNWNLGCPYPMVTNRNLGCGLMHQPEKIDRILEKVFTTVDVDVSIKMRLGFSRNTEILKLIPILNQYPIKLLGIHARLGKQLYKGNVDLDGFEQSVEMCRHKIAYNGDIHSLKAFRKLKDRFPEIDTWLLGRGIISDPFLAKMIKLNTLEYPEDRFDTLSKFHDHLMQQYIVQLGGAKQVILKMLTFWEYLSLNLSEPQKIVKMIKKAKTFEQYNKAVNEIFKVESAINFNINTVI